MTDPDRDRDAAHHAGLLAGRGPARGPMDGDSGPAGPADRASGTGCAGPDQSGRPSDQPRTGCGRSACTGDRGDDHGSGKSVDAAAAAAYQASITGGKPLSERKPAAMFGKSSRRWARNRVVEARRALMPAIEDSTQAS
ncbi:MAG: hypothetical protein M3Y33_03325 [Actinomycetota bacterium]|nr:hypothetical protein [Actinomycetota bacterium]